MKLRHDMRINDKYLIKHHINSIGFYLDINEDTINTLSNLLEKNKLPLDILQFYPYYEIERAKGKPPALSKSKDVKVAELHDMKVCSYNTKQNSMRDWWQRPDDSMLAVISKLISDGKSVYLECTQRSRTVKYILAEGKFITFEETISDVAIICKYYRSAPYHTVANMK